MSSVRVLVGTKKGAFILTADGQRRNWQITGPHFAGWEIYHVKGSSLDPNRLYASQSSGWFALGPGMSSTTSATVRRSLGWLERLARKAWIGVYGL